MSTATMAETFEILGQEFTLDELNDIATHGMSAGVPGFIYSSDLADIFDESEEEIWGLLDEQALEIGAKGGIQMCIDAIVSRNDDEYYTMQSIKEMAVWMYVETLAVQLLSRNKHPDWC